MYIDKTGGFAYLMSMFSFYSYIRDQGFSGTADRASVPNIMVIMTDGNSNDPEATMRAALAAKIQHIHIIIIG